MSYFCIIRGGVGLEQEPIRVYAPECNRGTRRHHDPYPLRTHYDAGIIEGSMRPPSMMDTVCLGSVSIPWMMDTSQCNPYTARHHIRYPSIRIHPQGVRIMTHTSRRDASVGR